MPDDRPEGPDGSCGHEPEGDELASIGQRALARIVDWIIVSTVLLSLVAVGLRRDGDDVEVPLWVRVTWLVSWMAYESVMLSRYGYTFGKLAARIKVVDVRSGARPAPIQAAVRTGAAVGVATGVVIVGGTSVGLVVPIALFFSAVFDRRTLRGVPDRVGGTVVVRLDPRPAGADPG